MTSVHEFSVGHQSKNFLTGVMFGPLHLVQSKILNNTINKKKKTYFSMVVDAVICRSITTLWRIKSDCNLKSRRYYVIQTRRDLERPA